MTSVDLCYYPIETSCNFVLQDQSNHIGFYIKDVKTHLQIVGLDPAFGFFHVMDDQRPRPSLALDMMGEFHPSITDIVVLTLILQKHITLQDFDRTDDEGLPIRLSKTGEQALIRAYEQRMAEKIFHLLTNGETSYRQAIEYQARQMRWIVEGRQSDYGTLQFK